MLATLERIFWLQSWHSRLAPQASLRGYNIDKDRKDSHNDKNQKTISTRTMTTKTTKHPIGYHTWMSSMCDKGLPAAQ